MDHLLLVRVGGAGRDEPVQQDAGEAEEAHGEPHEGDGHLGALLRPDIHIILFTSPEFSLKIVEKKVMFSQHCHCSHISTL